MTEYHNSDELVDGLFGCKVDPKFIGGNQFEDQEYWAREIKLAIESDQGGGSMGDSCPYCHRKLGSNGLCPWCLVHPLDTNPTPRITKPINNKPLIDHDFIAEMQDVLERGSQEHGDGHWKHRDIHLLEEFGHARNHLYGTLSYEIDADSGKSHWVHLACRAMIAWWKENKGV